MTAATTLRECPRCNETCEAELLRTMHIKGARSCPSCGFTARPSLFRVRLQPATNGRGAQVDAPDAGGDDAGELPARVCRDLDRVIAVLATATVTFAIIDVALALNIVRLLVVR